MIVLDGNESLKRLARPSNPNAIFDSSYYLSQQFVDSYAGEVISSANPDSQADIELIAEQPSCADKWKAASPDSTKKTWGIFDETGIFASACCHGFILWIADMRQGGGKCVV
jgi:hypothetical protein